MLRGSERGASRSMSAMGRKPPMAPSRIADIPADLPEAGIAQVSSGWEADVRSTWLARSE